jgi:UDP:flavonoid glycosyltransferase YjiC (YdhE family)
MFALGSRGDVQPFVGLALGLRDAGYQVRLATHGVFEDFVREAGLDFAPVEGNPQAIMQTEEGRAWVESQNNPLAFAKGFRTLLGPVMRTATDDALRAAADAEAIIIGGPSYYFARSVTEKLGLPFVQAYLQPLHPTTEFPSALFPMPLPKLGVFNYATSIIAGQLFYQLLRPVMNDIRRDVLHLKPWSRLGPFVDDMRGKYPILYGYSRHVIPKPKNWGDFIDITGYWFYDQPTWKPPAALTDFLAGGPAPVYVGFGSMADRNPERMSEIVVNALQKANQRGILLTGWGGLQQSDLPETIFKIASAPHSWLFPQMAAVVHHGGAGTTAAGLRAGVPSVLIPFFGDQPFWAECVDKLDVGPNSIPRKKLTVDNLTYAMTAAVSVPSTRANAATLGEQIRAENGVQNAVGVIGDYLEKMLGKPRPLLVPALKSEMA